MTFEEFVAARLRTVLRFAAVLTGDRSLAEDVVQEVLIRASARWQVIVRLDRPKTPVSATSSRHRAVMRKRWLGR